MENARTTQHTRISTLRSAIEISKPYFLTAMIKFPSVFNKNAILNSIIGILLLGGICSTFSNLILAKLSDKTSNQTFEEISKKCSGSMYKSVLFLTYLHRSLGILYLIDLSFKLVLSNSAFNFKNNLQILCFLFSIHAILLFLLTLDKLQFAKSRNIWTLVVLSFFTTLISGINYQKSSLKLNFFRNTNGYFESYGLVSICFSQQLATTPIIFSVPRQNKIEAIWLSGLLASLAYIGIGLGGYIAYPSSEVNWSASITNSLIRSILSTIILMINLMSLPFSIEPIKNGIDQIISIEGLNKKSVFSKLLLAFFYTFASIYFVKSPYGVIFLMISSSIITMILPCLYFSINFKSNVKYRLMLAFNFIVGTFLIIKSVKDILVTFNLIKL